MNDDPKLKEELEQAIAEKNDVAINEVFRKMFPDYDGKFIVELMVAYIEGRKDGMNYSLKLGILKKKDQE